MLLLYACKTELEATCTCSAEPSVTGHMQRNFDSRSQMTLVRAIASDGKHTSLKCMSHLFEVFHIRGSRACWK